MSLQGKEMAQWENWSWKVWNQGLVNLGFNDNKTWFGTNDYISSVIRQEDFQSGNHKDKIKLKGNQ